MRRAVALFVAGLLLAWVSGCGGGGGSGSQPVADSGMGAGSMPAGMPASSGDDYSGSSDDSEQSSESEYDSSSEEESYEGDMPGESSDDSSEQMYEAPGDESDSGMPGYDPSSSEAGDYGSGMPGMGTARSQLPEGYDAWAQYSFQEGRETDALNFLYAYALTDDEGAADLLPQIGWVNGLKVPSLAVRWGIGIQITPDHYVTPQQQVKIDVKPVGTTQEFQAVRMLTQDRGGYGRGGGGDAQPGYGGDSGAPGEGYASGGAVGAGDSLLKRLTGELSDRLMAEYLNRLELGRFGEVLREAPLARGRGAGAGGYGAEAGYGAEPGYGEGLEGESGSAGMGAMPGGYGAAPGRVGGGLLGRDASSSIRRGAQQLMPGLAFVGVGKQDDLLLKAAREGIQVLALFAIDIDINVRTKAITNKTDVVLLDVAKKEQLYASRELNNIRIQNARAKGGDDGVSQEFAKLFEYIDQNLTMSELPDTILPEHVERRVAMLTSASHDNPLPVLTEIRLWQRKNLLSEEALLAAFKGVAGDERGEQLVTGDEKVKQEVVEKWLPKFPKPQPMAAGGMAVPQPGVPGVSGEASSEDLGSAGMMSEESTSSESSEESGSSEELSSGSGSGSQPAPKKAGKSSRSGKSAP